MSRYGGRRVVYLVLAVTPYHFQRRLCDDRRLQHQFGEQAGRQESDANGFFLFPPFTVKALIPTHCATFNQTGSDGSDLWQILVIKYFFLVIFLNLYRQDKYTVFVLKQCSHLLLCINIKR